MPKRESMGCPGNPELNTEMNQKAQTRRFGEITINSNWIMTPGMAVGLVVCGVFLTWEIRDLVFDNVHRRVPLATVVGTVYCFLLAYSVREKSWKIALVLFGTGSAGRIISSYFHASSSLQHSADVVGSAAHQIALTIILVAIVQWFRSVIRWIPPSHPGAAD